MKRERKIGEGERDEKIGKERGGDKKRNGNGEREGREGMKR